MYVEIIINTHEVNSKNNIKHSKLWTYLNHCNIICCVGIYGV